MSQEFCNSHKPFVISLAHPLDCLESLFLQTFWSYPF